jgi:hypothetical protein
MAEHSSRHFASHLSLLGRGQGVRLFEVDQPARKLLKPLILELPSDAPAL